MGCGEGGREECLVFFFSVYMLLLKHCFGIATSPAPVEGLVLYMIEIPAYVLRIKEMLYSIV